MKWRDEPPLYGSLCGVVGWVCGAGTRRTRDPGLHQQGRRQQARRDRREEEALLAGEVQAPVGADTTVGDLELRRATARALHDAAQAVETYRFNVAVAKAMELVNATRKTIDTGAGAADPEVRAAVEAVAILLSLVAPYTAEDMWARLGHAPSVATAGWPAVDPALLVDDTVTCVVQIQGKVRARLEVAADISEADLRTAVLADSDVQKSLAGREIKTMIVRAPKLVNIVPA